MKLSKIFALLGAFSISCSASLANPPQYSGHNIPVVNGAVSIFNIPGGFAGANYSAGYNSGGYNLFNYAAASVASAGINVPALGHPTFLVPSFKDVRFQVLCPPNPGSLFVVAVQTANDGFYHFGPCTSTFVPGLSGTPNQWTTTTTGAFNIPLSHSTVSSAVIVYLGSQNDPPLFLPFAHVFGIRVESAYGPSSITSFGYLTGANDPKYRFE